MAELKLKKEKMSENSYAEKHIIQIQAAPAGWFILYVGYGKEPNPDETFNEKLEGYFVVPIAGWALWEDKETGKRGIFPYTAEGNLVDPQKDAVAKIAYRPDWLNVRLNGAERIAENSPFGIGKNRLEVEVRQNIYGNSGEG